MTAPSIQSKKGSTGYEGGEADAWYGGLSFQLRKVTELPDQWAFLAAGMQSSGKKLAADVAADSDEDNWDTGKGGSKRKKGARKRPAGKSKGNQSQATQNGKPQQG